MLTVCRTKTFIWPNFLCLAPKCQVLLPKQPVCSKYCWLLAQARVFGEVGLASCQRLPLINIPNCWHAKQMGLQSYPIKSSLLGRHSFTLLSITMYSVAPCLPPAMLGTVPAPMADQLCAEDTLCLGGPDAPLPGWSSLRERRRAHNLLPFAASTASPCEGWPHPQTMRQRPC